MGSAIFNILVIIAVTGMLAGQSLELTGSGARHVVVLAVDYPAHRVHARRNCGMVGIGVVYCRLPRYIVQMVYNQRIFDWLDTKSADARSKDEGSGKKGDHHGEAVAAAKRLSDHLSKPGKGGMDGLQAGDMAVIHMRQSALEAHVAAPPVERMTVDVMTDLTAHSGETDREGETDGAGRPKLKRTNSDPELERANSGMASWRSSHHNMDRQRARNPLLGSKFRAFRHRKAGLARTLTRSSHCSDDSSAPRKPSRVPSRSSAAGSDTASSARGGRGCQKAGGS